MSDSKKSAFSDFVDSKTTIEKPVDWGARKQLWLQKIDDLYADIESWFADYIKSGKMTLAKTGCDLTEEYIGAYETQRMTIKIGSDKIELHVVGTLILGGHGRIDVIGKDGKVMLILSHKDYRPGVTVNVFTSEQEKKEHDQKQKQEQQNKPQITRENLIWLYVRKSPRMEYFPLTREIFEEVIMAVSGN